MLTLPKQRILSKDGNYEVRLKQKTGAIGTHVECSLWRKVHRHRWEPTGRIATVPLQVPLSLDKEANHLKRAAKTLKYHKDGAAYVVKQAQELERQTREATETLRERLIEAIKSLVDDFDPDGGESSV